MKLLLINDPALRKVCEPVTLEELDFVKAQVPEMLEIIKAEEGAALAANQVGIIKRFFVLKDGTLVINPEILEMSPAQDFDEGCLSIPGTRGKTQRSQEIKFRYKDESFNDVESTLKGFDAVAIQHEIDHLDGKLYTDQLAPMRRALVLDKHRKFLAKRGKR